MPGFKLQVSDPKARTTTSYDVKDQQANVLVGLKIGDVVDASVVGVQGKIRVTGGSDRAGFPMRSDVSGGKKYALLVDGPGLRPRARGERRRKLVRGNRITDEIYQVNAVLAE